MKINGAGLGLGKMSQRISATAEKSDDEIDSDVAEQPCAVCGSPDDFDSCLLCDSCDIALHYNCVGLPCIPAGDWSCPWCVNQTVPTSKEVFIKS